MKVNARTIDAPNEVLLVLPRDDGDLVFKFRAVIDLSEFELYCPQPAAPRVKRPGGEVLINTNDPEFQKRVQEYATCQTNWQFLKSISATEGLEWDTVDMHQSATWANWQEDFKNSGFSVGELNTIWAHFMKANNLSELMLDEARKRFLASQVVAV